MSARFNYRPLQKDPPEIRLLQLLPAANQSLPLSCIIRNSALSSAKYSCLSYVWGDQSNDEKSEMYITYKKTIPERLRSKIRRGGKSGKCRVEIGSSLAAALRHLRHEHKRVTIWADALCINQEDTKEKNWQVPLMKQIYSNATSVHAWLGPRYDDSPDVISSVTDAFDLIAIVGDLLKRLGCMRRLADETSWSRACFALANPRGGDAHQEENELDIFWAAKSKRLYDTLVSNGLWDRYLCATQALSQLEYFRRMWVRYPEARRS